MAARNLKPGSVQSYQSETEKAQPSTLKRQPNPDWSKNDLLRLLSYFEGELQARDITIATLKAEKAKQLLYQAKYGRFGLGDPFNALQRDAEGITDTGFDEAAIKSMYDNQLAQLENLIATQRKAQLKMREQLGNSEKRFHKVCSELEDEKKKHAQDTAQGDDVTYMLEKERERLKAEIDFEKNQNKKLEKDLKKTLASLEDERANAARHKQVAIMLIKERKNLIERLVAENQLRDDMESALTDGKSRMQSMAEGLAEESKKSLKMEAALERQNQKFDGEREVLKVRLQEEEKTTGMLKSEVARLSQQLETLKQQVGDVGATSSSTVTSKPLLPCSSSPARVASPLKTGPSATPSHSSGVSGGSQLSVSPNVSSSLSQVKQSSLLPSSQSSSSIGNRGLRQTPGFPRPVLGAVTPPSATAAGKTFSLQQTTEQHLTQNSGQHGNRVLESRGQEVTSPDREVIVKPERKVGLGASNLQSNSASSRLSRPVRSEVAVGSTARVNIQQGTGAIALSSQHEGGKIPYPVSGGGSPSPGALSSVPVRRVGNPVGVTGSPSSLAAALERGVPPPIPPNKPNFGTTTNKPSLTPKGTVAGAYGDVLEKFGPTVTHKQQASPKAVQIPVQVVSTSGGKGSAPSQHSSGKHFSTAPGAGNVGITSVHTQCVMTAMSTATAPSVSEVQTRTSGSNSPAIDSGQSLEFLGPEMANLHQLLSTMTTGSFSSSTGTALTNSSPATLQCQMQQSAGSSSVSVPVQPKAISSQPIMKDLSSSTQSNSATDGLSSSQDSLVRHTVSFSPLHSHSSEAFDHVNGAPSVHVSKVDTVNISSNQRSFVTVGSNLSNSGVSFSRFSRFKKLVPLHIYGDHPSANPPTQTAKSVISSSTPSGQSNSSTAWSSISITGTRVTDSASSVITAQPLPSASALEGFKPVSNTGDVAVGVVVPTISHKLASVAEQSKLIKVTPVCSTTIQSSQNRQIHSNPAESVKLVPNPIISQALQCSSPAGRLFSSNNASPGSPGRLTVPDIIKQVSLSNSHAPSSTKDGMLSSIDPQKYPLHSACAQGDLVQVQYLLKEKNVSCNVSDKDGSTPLHYAAEYDQEECLKLLLGKGANPSSLSDDRTTPLHIASLKGHIGCLRFLLSKGAAVNLANASYMTPLQLAVKYGHTHCCQLLLQQGANVMFAAQDSLTSIHLAVQGGHLDTLRTLLNRLKLAGITRDSDTAHQLVAIKDNAGWTLAHMAAHLPTQDCLVMLSESLPLDFDATDKLGRTVLEVASKSCKEILGDFGRPANPELRVAVELRYILENTTVSNVKMGSMYVGPSVGWRVMEERLRATLLRYIAQLDLGLRTRRIARMEAETTDKDKTAGADKEFSLGLTMANIKQFEMGFYKWTPGMQTDTSPYLILCNNEQKKLTITVDDSDFMCELIAFDVLHQVSSINNYLRLIEQYKSVIFYGPTGSGKSYLAHKLAQSIAAQEITKGRKPSIYQLTLQKGFTYSKFLAYLKQRNCVVPVNKEGNGVAPILLLDNLETVDLAQLFGELLDSMEHRGIRHAFCLRGDDNGGNGMHYLTDQFYVIGTMDKARSLGVDLSILPRFRWVQFRLDTEPLRGLLARHFLRRLCNLYSGSLPLYNTAEDEEAHLFSRVKFDVKEKSGPVVLRTVEWIVCVWQRLNDSLLKLGLPDVVLGPCTFFRCPLESQDPTVILEWMKSTWNELIAPRVREAVRRGTGSEAASEGQQKVANTALYVLMQRSVILGCPLAGHEKDTYLAGFAGSNELDIPLGQQVRGGGGRGYVKTRATILSGSPSTSALVRQAGNSHFQSRLTPTSERARSVDSSKSPSVTFWSKTGPEERDWNKVTSNIKRRSLSESDVDKAVKQEQQQQQQKVLDGLKDDTTSISPSPDVTKFQAKVARLDFTPATSDKRTSASGTVTPQAWDRSPRLKTPSSALRKTGRISPLLGFVSENRQLVSSSVKGATSGYQKSRSSENISNVARRGLNQGPFSFSLATPTSNLSSFKFLNKSSDVNHLRESLKAKERGKSSLSLADMKFQDASVFSQAPKSTDMFLKNQDYSFMGLPPSIVTSGGKRFKKEGKDGEEEVWNKLPEPEVWSKRTDGFLPIEDREVNES